MIYCVSDVTQPANIYLNLITHKNNFNREYWKSFKRFIKLHISRKQENSYVANEFIRLTSYVTTSSYSTVCYSCRDQDTAGQLVHRMDTHTHTQTHTLSLNQTEQDSIGSEGPRVQNNSELI